MPKILFLAVDVQKRFCQDNPFCRTPADVQRYNQYASAIVKRITEFTLLPDITTIWVVLTAERVPHKLIPVTDPADIGQMDFRQKDCFFEAQPRAGDFILNKHGSSAFFNAHLESFIRTGQFTHIGIGGFWLHDCVYQTMSDACFRFPKTKPTLLSDLAGSWSPTTHEITLDDVERKLKSDWKPGDVSARKIVVSAAEFLESSKEKPALPAGATPVSQLLKPEL